MDLPYPEYLLSLTSSLETTGGSRKRKGGFDCEFVEPPPKQFIQSECPICLQIVCEPYQVDCCGHIFCQSCIERITWEEQACPTCKAEDFKSFPDVRFRRSLYSYKVHCTHQKNGCDWIGELSQLDRHLNSEPPPTKRLEGCPITNISCEFSGMGCEVVLPRKEMVQHMKESSQSHNSRLITQIDKLSKENQRLKSDILSLEGKYAKLEEKINPLINENESLRQSTEKQITELQEEVTRLKQLMHNRIHPFLNPCSGAQQPTGTSYQRPPTHYPPTMNPVQSFQRPPAQNFPMHRPPVANSIPPVQ